MLHGIVDGLPVFSVELIEVHCVNCFMSSAMFLLNPWVAKYFKMAELLGDFT